MPNKDIHNDCGHNHVDAPLNAAYIHNEHSTEPKPCCDSCGCHHPLRLWAVKYAVVGIPKFIGVAVVQARDLCNAEYVFIQDSKFNGFREYISITCIEELYPNPEPMILLESSVAVIDRKILGSYPWLTKEDFQKEITKIYESIALAGLGASESDQDTGDDNTVDNVNQNGDNSNTDADGNGNVTENTGNQNIQINSADNLNDAEYNQSTETLTIKSS